ncbi:predicted protein, partial [Nematostella vectensis]
AWVGSLAMSLTMAFSPLAAALVKRFGARVVGISGGVTAAIGLFATSQVPTLRHMYVAYSVVLGAGSSCAYLPGYNLIPRYF